MIHSLRRHEPISTVECATLATIGLHDRNHYIVRAHVFADKVRPHPVVGSPRMLFAWGHSLMAASTTWRRRYLTRRHLRWLDERGLADIGIDQVDRDREVARKFWQP